MKRIGILLPALYLFVATLTPVCSAQKIADISGTWEAITMMPDHNVTETWVIQQNGGNVTGTMKTAHGDLPVAGTLDGAGIFHVQVTDGDMQYKVRATLDKNDMDGSIKIGDNEYLWSAKRSK